ncbi:MAG: hypothetical protein OHK93_002067 [Ramalina farinacea]|uniref:FAD-binding domain-containing protein n=1 Tax=Ramalina farinacea TaxID=258253 RepID=A0AA43U016_9LECA|nr:hypothetical protein [Ramalina farinacea]
MALSNVVIIGAGICGLSTAISLHKLGVPFTIYEIRSEPSTIGGAVNLTPSALRYLDALDVLPELEQKGYPVRSIELFSIYTQKKFAELSFDNMPRYGFRAMRVLRKDLLNSLLNRLEKLGSHVRYGMRMSSINEDIQGGDTAKIRFEDGSVDRAGLIIGCDGIHSIVRTAYVQPSRKPIYTGLAAAYGLLPTSDIKSPIHFQDTSVNTSQSGSLIASYCTADKASMYFTALMQIESPTDTSRQGWRVRGADQESLRSDILARFKDGGIPCLKEMAEKVGELCLYPVNKLEPNGVWGKGRVVLLGDAAHAMPPQGESTGFAIEDAILFAHVLSKRAHLPVSDGAVTSDSLPIPDLITHYIELRRPKMEAAFKEADFRWETGKDGGWLAFKMKELLTPWFLWWYRGKWEKEFGEEGDVRNTEV